jgi:hypothetical protein
MGSTTAYKIELDYTVKGNAKAGLQGLAKDAKVAQSSFGGLRSAIGLALGAGAFALGKKYLYDYNLQITKLKVGLATTASMNFHKPFKEGALAADRMFNNFQKMATLSPSTTKDYVEMAQMISGAVLQSGKGLKDLEAITQGAITATNALGARPDMLALDIQQMLAGTLGAKDRYARQLLAGVGITDYHKFNKMEASKRADVTQQALSTPQLKDAAAAFGASTEGVMSTFQDNLQITLGKVGLPLLKAMTNEVKSWNAWMMANPEKIASFMSQVGSGLKEAFSIIRDIVVSTWPLVKDVFGVVASVLGFVSEHRDLLTATIKALPGLQGP